MAIDPIKKGDANAREKMNQAIGKANLVDGKADKGALLRLPIAAPVQHRPGDAPFEFGQSLAGGESDTVSPISEAIVRYDDAGRVVRLVGDALVAPRQVYAIEPGRRYQVAFAVQRRVNSPDPDNDAIRCALAWYGQGKGAMVTPASTTVEDLVGITTGSGRIVVRTVVARAAGADVDVVSPAGARYCRPYVQTFGTKVQNDVEVISWTDITDAVAFAPDVSALQAQIDAIGSLDLGDRLVELETQAVAPNEIRFTTIGALEAATVPASADTVLVLGFEDPGDDGGARYRRVPIEPSTEGKVQSADGAWWLVTGSEIDPRILGARGNDAADDTASVQMALAVGVPVVFSPGIYILDGVDIPTGAVMYARRPGTVTLKRKANAAAAYILQADGVNSFRVNGFTLDGNMANNTVAADNIAIVGGCYDFDVSDNKSKNAKYVEGRGNGIFVEENADYDQGTKSTVQRNRTSGNAVGIYALKVKSIDIDDNSGRYNTHGGIKLDDIDLPPPVSPSGFLLSVSRNDFSHCGVGVGIFGTRSAVTDLGELISWTAKSEALLIVEGNKTFNNDQYGLVVQADRAAVIGNIAQGNGNSASNGGILFVSANSLLMGNISTANYYYGVDAGFSYNCLIQGNIIRGNGPVHGSSIGLNLGANNGVSARSNQIGPNGAGTGTTYEILASALDGSLEAWGPFVGFDLLIADNDIRLGDANSVGVNVRNGYASVNVENNTFINRAGGEPLQIRTAPASTRCRGNSVLGPDGSWRVTVASAGYFVIPEHGEIIEISGTEIIDNLRSASQHYGADKVFQVNMSNVGSGYASPPAVSFSGGGGTGAAGLAALAADGKIYGVYITSGGSGYTSAPAVSFSGGGGADAAGTAFIGCDASQDRVVTLVGNTAFTVRNSTGPGNIFLNGGVNFVSGFGKALTLRSSFGSWLEVSRAG